MKDYFFSNVQTADLYATHCLIKDMFPGDEKLLWARSSNGALVRSKASPISKGATFIERAIPEITKGLELSFSLNAMACIQRQRVRDGISKKIIHQIHPSQEDSLKVWLLNRCHANGFALMDLDIASAKEPIFRKGQLWEINYTQYTGGLMVTDADKFTNVVHNGLSRSKAFGLGLFQIS